MALKSVPRFFRKTAGGHFVQRIFISMGGPKAHVDSLTLAARFNRSVFIIISAIKH